MNILLVAEEAAGIQVLRLLVASDHDVVGVLTAPPAHGGGATVGTVAAGFGLETLPSARVKEPALADWIRAREVDLLLNVHSLYVVHEEVVAAPALGSFNLHPGPLPEYAGLNAPSWAIYHGRASHAVTLHWMEPGIDTGAIAYTCAFELDDKATGLSVSLRCAREGLPLVAQLLEDAAAGTVPAIPQPGEGRRYFGREAPNGGRVTWARPAAELGAFVRACDYFPFASPWGQPIARLAGRELELLKASPSHARASAPPGTVGAALGRAARVATRDDWLVVERVRLDGATLDGAEALQPGMRLEDG